MAGESAEKGWLDKLRHNYRLVIMNSETFEEVGSYKLSLLNVYILLSTVVVLVALLVIGLIVMTPIKRYIPGYGDAREHAELIRLTKQLEEMEQEIAAQLNYTNNFKKILVGEIEPPEAPDANLKEIPDSALEVERIQEDELLRKEIELSQKIQDRELFAQTANFKPDDVPLERLYLMPPITGMVSEAFNLENEHYGIDVMAPKSTPIRAVLDGYVFISDWTLETGHTIGIQHNDNIITFYKHNSALLKQVGSYVKAGEAIAIIGNTGTLSNGPHLHFELWHKGNPIDPTDHIAFE